MDIAGTSRVSGDSTRAPRTGPFLRERRERAGEKRSGLSRGGEREGEADRRGRGKRRGRREKIHPAEDRESQVGEKEGTEKRPGPDRLAFREAGQLPHQHGDQQQGPAVKEAEPPLHL